MDQLRVLHSVQTLGCLITLGTTEGYLFYNSISILKLFIFFQTWKDSGSGSSRDVSFWQPICNQGFVGLGDLCKIGHGKPSKVAMKCVRKDLTKPCGKTQIWTDKGTGAWSDAIVFKSYDQLVQGMITSRRQAFCIK